MILRSLINKYDDISSTDWPQQPQHNEDTHKIYRTEKKRQNNTKENDILDFYEWLDRFFADGKECLQFFKDIFHYKGLIDRKHYSKIFENI